MSGTPPPARSRRRRRVPVPSSALPCLRSGSLLVLDRVVVLLVEILLILEWALLAVLLLARVLLGLAALPGACQLPALLGGHHRASLPCRIAGGPRRRRWLRPPRR